MEKSYVCDYCVGDKKNKVCTDCVSEFPYEHWETYHVVCKKEVCTKKYFFSLKIKKEEEKSYCSKRENFGPIYRVISIRNPEGIIWNKYELTIEENDYRFYFKGRTFNQRPYYYNSNK